MSGTIEGIAFMAIGGGLVGAMGIAVRRGRMRDRRFTLERAKEPRIFWSVVAWLGLLGIALLILGIRDFP